MTTHVTVRVIAGSVTPTGVREGDVILVGPLKRLARVREAVPLDGGVEIYATDRCVFRSPQKLSNDFEPGHRKLLQYEPIT